MLRTVMLAAAAVCLAGTALADPDAQIKYRQGAMDTIGAQLGSVAAILKGDIENKDALQKHAELLAAATDPAITIPAFEPNTDGQGSRETTATAKIWSDWDDFKSRLDKLHEAAQSMASAGADISGDHVKAVGGVCKGCHDNYREKK
jgi:cytochrome c556